MRKLRLILLTLFALGIAVAALYFALPGPGALKKFRAPGRGTVSIWHVHYGEWEAYRPATWRRELAENLPSGFPPKLRRLIYWDMGYTPKPVEKLNPANPALYIWVSMSRPKKAADKITIYRAEIVDSHGWTHHQTSTDRVLWQDSLPGFGYLVFENFPRHERQLRVILFDRHDRLGEFTIDNPAFQEMPAQMQPNPMPVEAALDGDHLRLESVEIVQREWPSDQVPFQPLRIRPAWSWTESADPPAEWRVVGLKLLDGWGNVTASSRAALNPIEVPALNPFAPAWKLTAEVVAYRGSQGVQFASATIPGPPEDGGFTALGETLNIGNAAFSLVAIAGPGEFTYRDEGPVAGSPGAFEGFNTEYVFDPSNPAPPRRMVRSFWPHLAIRVSGIARHQYYTVRLTDREGNEAYCFEHTVPPDSAPTAQEGRAPDYLGRSSDRLSTPYLTRHPFPRLTGSPLTVTIGLHTSREVGFTFAPPGELRDLKVE